jgi:hypothetical protein
LLLVIAEANPFENAPSMVARYVVQTDAWDTAANSIDTLKTLVSSIPCGAPYLVSGAANLAGTHGFDIVEGSVWFHFMLEGTSPGQQMEMLAIRSWNKLYDPACLVVSRAPTAPAATTDSSGSGDGSDDGSGSIKCTGPADYGDFVLGTGDDPFDVSGSIGIGGAAVRAMLVIVLLVVVGV